MKPALAILAVFPALVMLASPAAAHPDIEAEIGLVTAKLTSEPRDFTHYIRRGDLFRRHLEWDRAESDYDQAARLSPQSPMPETCRARLLLECGKPAEAETLATAIIAKHPGNPSTRLVRADIRLALKKPAEAAADLTEAIKNSHPPTPEMFLERTRLLATLPDGLPPALASLEEGLKSLGNPPPLLEAAHTMETKAARHEKALSLARRLCEASRSPRNLCLTAETLAALEKPTEAAALVAEAVQLIQSLPPARQRSEANIELLVRLKAISK